MRQVVLDTETTGLEVEQEHRIIEIGCVELFNRRLTGRSFHQYLNPERDIDEGAVQVHGLTRERLGLARPDAIVMHPQPMNRGIEIASEVADGPQSVIRDQVRNGVAVRMAVLAEVLTSRPGGA